MTLFPAGKETKRILACWPGVNVKLMVLLALAAGGLALGSFRLATAPELRWGSAYSHLSVPGEPLPVWVGKEQRQFYRDDRFLLTFCAAVGGVSLAAACRQPIWLFSRGAWVLLSWPVVAMPPCRLGRDVCSAHCLSAGDAGSAGVFGRQVSAD